MKGGRRLGRQKKRLEDNIREWKRLEFVTVRTEKIPHYIPPTELNTTHLLTRTHRGQRRTEKNGIKWL